jgi:hypothetical protein
MCGVWCVWFVSVLAVLVAGDDATQRSWMTACKCRGVVVLCCCWRCESVGLSWVEFVCMSEVVRDVRACVMCVRV